MNTVVFEKYTGNEEIVRIDFAEGGKAITTIGAKAFLSCKTIKKLEIASSVTEIGDWAFAHMQNLEVLVLPFCEFVVGRKVFLDCGKLVQIQISGDESKNPGLPFFLASAVRVLKQDELCKPVEAADSTKHKEWMRAYDFSLMQFLCEDDEKGFDPVFFGWFRVEDIDDQLPVFLAGKRRDKVQLIFERLFYPTYLQEENRKWMLAYLSAHMNPTYFKDCFVQKEKGEMHSAVYDFFCEENSPCRWDIRYYKILKENDLLHAEWIERFLVDIKEPAAEVTAYLLKEKAKLSQKRSFFDDFGFDL